MHALTHLNWLDTTIVILYFIFIIGIGFYTKKHTKSSSDFFMAGRRNSAWIAGIAFLSANMGALELLGMAGQSYQYGLLTAHFYFIGAIPAMLFLGVFMMPFYYSKQIHSIPGYLQKRFNTATHTLNAYTFAIMTLLMSGINMYAMALVLHVFIGWDFSTSVWISSLTVALYIALGGLASAIFSEVMQFFVIWFGLLLAVFLGYIHIGGWSEIAARLPSGFVHLWQTTGHASHNPMLVDWFGIVFGLGFVLSFGYWTTDYLVVQRAFSAKNVQAARMTPIIASFFKMLLPIIVVLAGLVVLALVKSNALPALERPDDALLYLTNLVYPHGLLGLGVTALLAGFMAGQAGNISAFNTVFTYDIYRTHMRKNASDRHYLMVGRLATIIGILISIGTAYLAKSMPTIMDYMQTLFSIVNAPLFGIILLGMFSARITGWGAFVGMLAGMVSALLLYYAIDLHWMPAKVIAFTADPSPMALNFWRAIWAFVITVLITLIISWASPRPDKAQLEGLIYRFGAKTREHTPWHKKPALWAFISLIVLIVLNLIFW